MGYKWQNGVLRSEEEIEQIGADNFKTVCFLVALVIVIWAVNHFLEWAGIIESEPEEKVEQVQVVDPPVTKSKASGSTVGGRQPNRAPTAPPSPSLEQLAIAMETDPSGATTALLETFNGIWVQTGDPVVIGEVVKDESLGLIFQVRVPKAIGDKAGYRAKNAGAETWSKWQNYAVSVERKRFEDRSEEYVSLSYNEAMKLFFIDKEEVLLSVVTKLGQGSVYLKMARVSPAGANKAVGGEADPASQAITEALTVFRDGTIDEAKVLIARLDEAAVDHPGNKVIPSLKKQVMTVFRAEHALIAREQVFKGGGALDTAQDNLKDAKNQQKQLQVDKARQNLKEAISGAEEFCREAGDTVTGFKIILPLIKERSGI